MNYYILWEEWIAIKNKSVFYNQECKKLTESWESESIANNGKTDDLRHCCMDVDVFIYLIAMISMTKKIN